MFELDTLNKEIDGLSDANLPPQVAEKKLLPILETLLGFEGFSVIHTGGFNDQGIDFLAEGKSEKIAIQQKHFAHQDRAVSMSLVHQMIGSAIANEIQRVIIVSNTKFSQEARELVKKNLPVSIDLVDVDALRAWGARLRPADKSPPEEAIQLINSLSQQLALLVARDPSVLNVLEWRDLERLLAEVMDGIGFAVTLTPGSKDSGKDLILECSSNSSKATYIIEVKHWRSGQRVGASAVTDFLNVIMKENRAGGVFLSTYGYCDNAFEKLAEIERQTLKFGSQQKIVSLCRRFSKIRSGIFMQDQALSEVLFEETI